MSTIDFWTAVSAIGVCLSALFTATSLLVLSRQIAETRRFTRAQFINELEKEFNSFSGVFTQLRQPKQLEQVLNSAGEERGEFYRCLDFFERVKTLVDIGVLDVPTLDRVLGFPFLLLVNNPKIQALLLFSSGRQFAELFALHKQLTDFRRKRRQTIPLSESDLALYNPTLYAENLKLYQSIK